MGLFGSIRPDHQFLGTRLRQARSSPGARIAAAIFVCANSVILIAASYWMPASTAGLALAIVWLGLLPLGIHLMTTIEARVPFPLLGLSGVFYSAFFGLSAFLLPFLNHPGAAGSLYGLPAPEFIATESQVLVLAGMAVCYGMYAIGRQYVFTSLPRLRFEAGPDNSLAFVLLWGLLLAHLAYLYVPLVRGLPSVGQFLQPVGLLALGGFFVLWRKRQLDHVQGAIVGLLVLPLIIAKMVLNAFLTPLGLMALFLLCLEVWMSRRIPWKVTSLCGVLMVTAFMLMGPVRGAFFSEPGMSMDLRGKVNRIWDGLVAQYDPEKPATFKMVDLGGKVSRVSHILVLDRVVKATPDAVPYWAGETYKPLFTSFVPRAVWPGKPREVAGNMFGRRYGFLNEAETGISVNIPWITEMYANFGSIGVLGGMAIVGILLSFLQGFFCRPGMSMLETVAGMTIVFPLFYQESNFSVMTGSLLPLAVCIWIYFKVGLRLPLPSWANR